MRRYIFSTLTPATIDCYDDLAPLKPAEEGIQHVIECVDLASGSGTKLWTVRVRFSILISALVEFCMYTKRVVGYPGG